MSAALRLDDMTIYTAEENKKNIVQALSDDVQEIDLSEVTEIDTSGIQLLLMARKQADKQEKPLNFIAASDEVKNLVRQLHLSEFLQLEI